MRYNRARGVRGIRMALTSGDQIRLTPVGRRPSGQRFARTVDTARRQSNGHALIEFALVVPLLVLLVVNVVNFGGLLYAWVAVSNAARSGVQYMVLGGATIASPPGPTTTAVTNVVTADLAGMPNLSTVQIYVCTNYVNRTPSPVVCSGTWSPGPNPSPPSDPEPNQYTSASVDVRYTYTPLIGLWDFPGLKIHATVPPTTVHRQAAMRMLQ